MGHRHFVNPSYMFESENDPSWNLTEHPYAIAAESSSLVYPAHNMAIDGAQYASHCNPAPGSSGYSSLSHSIQMPRYQQDVAGPSDLSAHPLSNYGNRTFSSDYNGHSFHKDDFFDLREMPNMDFLHAPWEYPPVNPNRTLSIDGETSLRNVRSRAALDLETGLVRTHLSNNIPPDNYTTTLPMDVSSLVDIMGESSRGPGQEWNPSHISAATHESGSHNHELNPFLVGSSISSASVEIGGHNNDFTRRRNGIPQNIQGTSVQSNRGVQSSYAQRSTPTFRPSASSLRLGHPVASDEGLQLETNSYSSRHPRPLSRISSERGRSFSQETSFRDRPTEGLTIVDRSTLYGSRNPFDEHQDMRLDIDDMSYEELLALGERIGSVSTGLSKDLISKCLRESIYCSSDQMQDEGTCVICLENYANMDDVGMLKACRHNFHVSCIRKWLSMKNLCPICKAEPMKERK